MPKKQFGENLKDENREHKNVPFRLMPRPNMLILQLFVLWNATRRYNREKKRPAKQRIECKLERFETVEKLVAKRSKRKNVQIPRKIKANTENELNTK